MCKRMKQNTLSHTCLRWSKSVKDGFEGLFVSDRRVDLVHSSQLAQLSRSSFVARLSGPRLVRHADGRIHHVCAEQKCPSVRDSTS